MSSVIVSEASTKPYVSRRKRNRRRQKSSFAKLQDLLSTRSVLGLLGLLLLVLIVSLGIIITHASSDFMSDDRDHTAAAY